MHWHHPAENTQIFLSVVLQEQVTTHLAENRKKWPHQSWCVGVEIPSHSIPSSLVGENQERKGRRAVFALCFCHIDPRKGVQLYFDPCFAPKPWSASPTNKRSDFQKPGGGADHCIPPLTTFPLISDIDECETGQHACPSTATCTNEVGSYQCQCGYGYYGDRGTCLSKYTSVTVALNSNQFQREISLSSSCLKATFRVNYFKGNSAPICNSGNRYKCFQGLVFSGHECPGISEETLAGWCIWKCIVLIARRKERKHGQETVVTQ